ncbi:MAG: flavodoxin-dependent (E)-4-hydroxy-3-methylbut-2-enyl-diphosphate synthase [Holosporales bacterium]|jgi:(E)-4-hydroxy-3-methylbut-2-enyl-diphosphate synthase|nr:flavodoxin-dependent (E)-4-hydroxy-3-methylbut-2-enyl-diphosphate synthase [Holosporales bacterium]
MSSKNIISVGGIQIGGGQRITVQTMTNTNTEDIRSTVTQIREAVIAGCDLIRVSCPTKESAAALKEIVKQSEIPIIADIHFDYKLALSAIKAGVHCIRINPGNINIGLNEIIKSAKDNNVAIRIGVNSGSIEHDILDKHKKPNAEALVESAVRSCRRFENLDFFNFKVSVKSSDVGTAIMAYRKLSKEIDYPLHLGITEAGPVFSGMLKSAIGIGSLLVDGIGDTIRVSLSGSIVEEIKIGKQILKSLSLLENGVNIVSCPTCARALIDVVGIAEELEIYTANLKKSLKISILGCVVNGPGEAAVADIGVFGFKTGLAKIYVNGIEYGLFEIDMILEEVKKIITNL